MCLHDGVCHNTSKVVEVVIYLVCDSNFLVHHLKVEIQNCFLRKVVIYPDKLTE